MRSPAVRAGRSAGRCSCPLCQLAVLVTTPWLFYVAFVARLFSAVHGGWLVRGTPQPVWLATVARDRASCSGVALFVVDPRADPQRRHRLGSMYPTLAIGDHFFVDNPSARDRARRRHRVRLSVRSRARVHEARDRASAAIRSRCAAASSTSTARRCRRPRSEVRARIRIATRPTGVWTHAAVQPLSREHRGSHVRRLRRRRAPDARARSRRATSIGDRARLSDPDCDRSNRAAREATSRSPPSSGDRRDQASCGRVRAAAALRRAGRDVLRDGRQPQQRERLARIRARSRRALVIGRVIGDLVVGRRRERLCRWTSTRSARIA